MFFAQETVLSGLYLWKSRDLLGRYNKPKAVEEPSASIRQYASPRASTSLRVVKSILTQLIIVNIIILFLDITIVVLEVNNLRRKLLRLEVPSSPAGTPADSAKPARWVVSDPARVQDFCLQCKAS